MKRPPIDSLLASPPMSGSAALRPSRAAAAGHRRRAPRLAVTALLVTLVASGCSAILESPPAPTPLDFPGMAGQLARQGLAVDSVTSGDAGCDDPTLAATAIGFSVSGLDLPAPVRLRVYIFRDAATYQRRRADVDRCAAGWASDPATFEFVDASPYVLAGQGPWPARFAATVRAALVIAAGNGG